MFKKFKTKAWWKMRTRLSLNEPLVKCLRCNLEMEILLKLRNKRIYGCTKCRQTSTIYGKMVGYREKW